MPLVRELAFDLDDEITRISEGLKRALRKDLNRRGLVVGISGGIDSSVSAALAVRAIGAARVYALLMPEQDSSSEGFERARRLVEHLGLRHEIHDIADTLRAIGCYRQRDDAIRTVFPDYGEGWRNKITIHGGLAGQVNHFRLVVEDPAGRQEEKALPLDAYLTIVAATNFKQRIRKTLEYFHADRLNYAVIGTPNRLEYDQGFFVKNGDGSADVKPIAHLYKTQVYALGAHLGLPDDIVNAVPTTDTYSLEQGQDEFYFALPYEQMDVALWYRNNERSSDELARTLNIDPALARHIFDDIDAKRRTSRYLHAAPVLMAPV
ncbi:MAG: NAD(+) synthase [Pseudomonadales bacterium]|nr:NAD(+) synthase [Pseudomonadales bacterium]